MFVDTLYDKLCQALPTRFYLDGIEQSNNNNTINQDTQIHNFTNKPPIQILNNPSHFYNLLLNEISSAKNKIFLTSLYIGEKELELVNTIEKRLIENPDVKVYFLLDGIRNTRHFDKTKNRGYNNNNNNNDGTNVTLNSSIDHIAKLISEFGSDRVICNLYMTPKYTQWKRFWYPKRFNEVIGLQHMKFYGFDDEKIVITGANLSRDYFTNRQDRYFVINSTEINKYYFKLMNLINKISYRLDMTNLGPKISWPIENLTVEPTKNKFKFISDVSNCLSNFINESNFTKAKKDNWQTVVFPISQFTPLFEKRNDNSNELKTILNILNELNKNNSTPSKDNSNKELIDWIFTAGYFNIIPPISKSLLQANNHSKEICQLNHAENIVITASPKANGFYQSKGISKHLPSAYLYLSKKFLKRVEKLKQNNANRNKIQLREWERGVVNQPNGWSYHAKGIWFRSNTIDPTKDKINNPILTIVGSSNYTSRSYSLDLESNLLILTKDPILQKNLSFEINNLLQYTKPISLNDFSGDRHISKTIKFITNLVKKKL